MVLTLALSHCQSQPLGRGLFAVASGRGSVEFRELVPGAAMWPEGKRGLAGAICTQMAGQYQKASPGASVLAPHQL